MSQTRFGRFRLLLNFVFLLFGRKPVRVSCEVEWEAVPYSWNIDWCCYPSQGGEPLGIVGKVPRRKVASRATGNTKRVTPPASK